MSDRTHQYRQLGRRDPATTAELYTRDGDGNPIPMATSPDGKLVVEVTGGGGGGGGVIQAKAPGATPSDPRVTVDLYATGGRELLVAPKADSQVLLRGQVPAVPAVPGPTPGDPPLVPAVPAYAVSVKATPAGEIAVVPKDDATVVMRGIVPEVVEVPGPSPGDPPLVPGVPAYAKSLKATDEGELAVAIAAPVALRARLDGSSPPSDVLLKANVDGQLHVAIEDSVTVPVEVQGIAEVKATSVNFWALAKGNGPVVIPNFSDADGWFDVRAFSRFSATGIGTGYTYDLAAGFVARGGTVHRVATYAELTAAITAATAGDIILLSDGVYEVPIGTLTINKSLVLIGESRDGVVIQTPVQTVPGVTHVITVDASNVEIRNLTVYHRQTTVSSGQQESCINVTAGRVGTIIDTCRITYCEHGLVMRGQFSVRSCIVEFSPIGPALPGTYRGIALYGMTADSEIIDVTASFRAGTASNTPRFLWLGSVAGDTYAGELVVARCQLGTGYVHQWVEIQTLPGTAGAFSLAAIDNTFAAGNANIIFSGTVNTDVLGSLTLSGNSVARVDKGLFGTDGARTTPLTVHVAGNTATEPGTLRADYISLFDDWAVTARNTVNTQYTVVGDAIIPDLGIPAETGSSVLLEDPVHVDVKYRVSMFEPHEHQLASGNLNSAYHAIVNPEEPKDILGIGYLRLVARDSSRDGHFAVFGSGK